MEIEEWVSRWCRGAEIDTQRDKIAFDFREAVESIEAVQESLKKLFLVNTRDRFEDGFIELTLEVQHLEYHLKSISTEVGIDVLWE